MLYAADAFGNAERKMGRQQAGQGMLAALIRSTQSSHFPVVATRQEDLSALRQQAQLLQPGLNLHLWPLDKLDRLSGVDALLVADPALARWAEARQWHQKGAAAWSLIGMTHTLSSVAALEALRGLPASPIRAWDALICTSRCAREAVQVVLAHQAELLARRFGGQARAWDGPQLPVIPLGCDLDRFQALAAGREQARVALGLQSAQVVLLFVGRLELHAKAHPGVMLQALSRVAQHHARETPDRPRPCLLVLGTARSQATAAAWREAVDYFSRWFDLRLLDGQDDVLSDQAWSAADLFISLADSLQETFGLTPVEAMARGVPVICTDWNGYRDTVVDGLTGCLIPTSQPGPATSHRLAELALGRLRYDDFMADLMQQVVVDEDALVVALERLLNDASMRQRMGEAGQRRARQLYDWNHVVGEIRSLAADLTEKRMAAVGQNEVQGSFPSPWQQFASWPSRHHQLAGNICLDPNRFQQRLALMEQLQIYARFSTAADPPLRLSALRPLSAHLQTMAAAQSQTFVVSIDALQAALPDQTAAALQHALAWLAKIGALELSA